MGDTIEMLHNGLSQPTFQLSQGFEIADGGYSSLLANEFFVNGNYIFSIRADNAVEPINCKSSSRDDNVLGRG